MKFQVLSYVKLIINFIGERYLQGSQFDLNLIFF